ncbi:MAG TPA: helix-turn-helix domain-containing protein [Thermomicrobiales bacterium]|nr:helix-turn-helix domain-containing protein [Thermomicrobiales bacterium]
MADDQSVWPEAVWDDTQRATNQDHSAQRDAGMIEQNATMRFALDLQNGLIDLALAERGASSMVDHLSAKIGNPVALADQLFHLIASSPRGEHGDRHRREALAHGGTPRRVLDDPLVGAYFRLVAERRCPTLLPAFPEHGMDRRRLMAPVLANDEIIGYVTVLEERPFSEALPATLEQAAKILALELLKRRVALETELHLMTDFLGDLLTGRYANRDAVVSRAGFLGVDLFRSWIVLLVGTDDVPALCAAADAANPVAAHQKLFEVIRRRVRQLLPGGIVAVQGESIVVLHPATTVLSARTNGPDALADELRRETVRMLPGASVTVAVSGVCRSLDDFPVRYAEARRALDVARGLQRRDQTVALEDLGLYGLLFRREDADELRRFADRLLGPLFAYDARRGTCLLDTLDAYLAEGGAFRATARRLGIHLNTLRGRLERIAQLGEVNLGDAKTRLDLQIALEIARVAGQNGRH